MLDIGQQQLLVLLLVVQAERRELADLRIAASHLQQLEHRPVDMMSIVEDLEQGRPGQQAALRPRVHVTGRVVIGVEEKVVLLIEAPVSGKMRLQHEALEEPGDMRQVPLRRAHIRHGLHDAVFRLEVGNECKRKAANAQETVGQGVGRFFQKR